MKWILENEDFEPWRWNKFSVLIKVKIKACMEMLFGVQRRWILSICFLGRSKVLLSFYRAEFFSLFILGLVSHTRRGSASRSFVAYCTEVPSGLWGRGFTYGPGVPVTIIACDLILLCIAGKSKLCQARVWKARRVKTIRNEGSGSVANHSRGREEPAHEWIPVTDQL